MVVTEATAANFKAKWGIGTTEPDAVVLGGWNQGLGNGDEINVYDNTNSQVDRLTYTSALRTQGKTGVPDYRRRPRRERRHQVEVLDRR